MIDDIVRKNSLLSKHRFSVRVGSDGNLPSRLLLVSPFFVGYFCFCVCLVFYVFVAVGLFGRKVRTSTGYCTERVNIEMSNIVSKYRILHRTTEYQIVWSKVYYEYK